MSHRKYLLATLAVLSVFALAETDRLYYFAVYAYEQVSFAYAPSAEKALEFGERHFSAGKKALYDIDRADFFFKKAAAINPSLSYLNHEQARISFLKGNFK